MDVIHNAKPSFQMLTQILLLLVVAYTVCFITYSIDSESSFLDLYLGYFLSNHHDL